MKTEFNHQENDIFKAIPINIKELTRKLDEKIPIYGKKESEAIEQLIKTDKLTITEKVLAAYILGLTK